VHAEFCLVELKEEGCFADKGVSVRIILKRIFKKSNGEPKLGSSAER
jgi:hypothetical protein